MKLLIIIGCSFSVLHRCLGRIGEKPCRYASLTGTLMTVFCTYCSAKKDCSQGELPAIHRYLSHRIKSVYIAAMSLGLKFLILSGKHGILKPSDPIQYYDHPLRSSEVSEHSKKVADQLQDLGVKDLIFFSKSISDDENVKPYSDCIKFASQKAGIRIKFVDLTTNET